ncbi:hypothetical protein AVEN_193683-1 [Araneus ventricosus]|uniref:Uncharacterized protein n=1 Tax=Araneus ventricosus TaxID=182803 RepID=A0A4Y2I0Z7_ARAVE|nr:hypothetical protein AVEN_193683-1 [Araneus ventricosus]
MEKTSPFFTWFCSPIQLKRRSERGEKISMQSFTGSEHQVWLFCVQRSALWIVLNGFRVTQFADRDGDRVCGRSARPLRTTIFDS